MVMNVKAAGRVTRLVYGGEELLIGASDGIAVIANAQDVFSGGIDETFAKRTLMDRSLASDETALSLHQVLGGHGFATIFTDINYDLDELVLSQAQIIRFCEKYSDSLAQYPGGINFLSRDVSHYLAITVVVKTAGPAITLKPFWQSSPCKGFCCVPSKK